MRFRDLTCLLFMAVLFYVGAATAEEKPQKLSAQDRTAIRDALEEFNSLIGGWRGMGQVRRGSNRGAWLEHAEWVWQLKSDTPALRYEVEKGKHLKSALLTYAPSDKKYHLETTLPDKTKREYSGEIEDDRLVLQSDTAADGSLYRITVTRLNEKRTLVLFQKRGPNRKQFTRVAEVGYTREGTKLAELGGGSPECIVTGGKGTSTIEYMGKTYYLCCSGCREVFLDDPETVIAEAQARLEKKKAAKK